MSYTPIDLDDHDSRCTQCHAYQYHVGLLTDGICAGCIKLNDGGFDEVREISRDAYNAASLFAPLNPDTHPLMVMFTKGQA